MFDPMCSAFSYSRISNFLCVFQLIVCFYAAISCDCWLELFVAIPLNSITNPQLFSVSCHFLIRSLQSLFTRIPNLGVVNTTRIFAFQFTAVLNLLPIDHQRSIPISSSECLLSVAGISRNLNQFDLPFYFGGGECCEAHYVSRRRVLYGTRLLFAAWDLAPYGSLFDVLFFVIYRIIRFLSKSNNRCECNKWLSDSLRSYQRKRKSAVLQ